MENRKRETASKVIEIYFCVNFESFRTAKLEIKFDIGQALFWLK